MRPEPGPVGPFHRPVRRMRETRGEPVGGKVVFHLPEGGQLAGSVSTRRAAGLGHAADGGHGALAVPRDAGDALQDRRAGGGPAPRRRGRRDQPVTGDARNRGHGGAVVVVSGAVVMVLVGVVRGVICELVGDGRGRAPPAEAAHAAADVEVHKDVDDDGGRAPARTAALKGTSPAPALTAGRPRPTTRCRRPGRSRWPGKRPSRTARGLGRS